VTIDVEGADTGGKRLQEGDFIDISMAVEGTHPDLGEVLTRTLLQNVLIVDALLDKPIIRGKRTSVHNPSTITVAVTPADANKLIVAERSGTLVATLVSQHDVDAGGAVGLPDSMTRRQLLGLKDVPPPKKYVVEKWSGSSMRVYEMSDDRIRESREVTTGRREAPIEAPPTDNHSTSIPSGVQLPYAAAAAPEQPVVK
jgi:Flp pilus assembly protein CpaB